MAINKQLLTELGEAITKAGGITATGEFGFGRDHHTTGLECYHCLEADTIEPWTPWESSTHDAAQGRG